ncbi:DNA cytosine methyltransferase [Actinotignum urinale]|uniref:DNA cytosine methyltransferase n=1 Tax=Actinotignum urinale TaxID=190146 RepID=UPI0003B6B5AF|nr:DNA cytosine methyltransferase [Actinotignum urinale]MDY5159678.1 DNA cytosine methyltransferase [Actinotignum urinale]
MRLNAIDLFAGVGGLSLGFEKAGFNILMANEYDPQIAQAYKANHSKTNMVVGDIRDLPIEATFKEYLGKTDIVIGGPPCQGFSQKGKRKSIHDDRNYLFKHFVRVVAYLKPTFFLMENVPNLLTTNNGSFKAEIIKLFGDLGYTVNAQILNAADFGVPQNRRRAFILGYLGDAVPSLPLPLEYKTSTWEAISDLAYLNSGEGENQEHYRFDPQSEYQKKMRYQSSLLHNHTATRHSALALERMRMIPPERGKECLPEEHLTKSIYSGTWGRIRKDEVSVTITTRFDTPSSGRFVHPFLDRAITVREAARLQSFPDNFVFYGTKSSQMLQVGNAVPPLLGEAIAKEIIKQIRGEQ